MARGCPSVWANLPCAWTASRWAEPDKCTLAEFIPACRLCADPLPVAAVRTLSWPCVPVRHLRKNAGRKRAWSDCRRRRRRHRYVGFHASPSRLEIRDATSAGGNRDPDTERKDAGDFGARRHRCARYKALDRMLGPEFINRHIDQACGDESGFQLERGIERDMARLR